MEIFLDPSTYVALGTLIILEVVLGIDNLVFIAILAEKLPPHQRQKARVLGLGLALGMRFILLTLISHIVKLTTPLFDIGPFSFSGRDLIMLAGGVFLLFKATTELHERLDNNMHEVGSSKGYAGFTAVVVQIMLLDAVFSLDAVITAVGMADHLIVMMLAVTIAMGVMLLASKPLSEFISRHPTIVVLCLSFLLLIGLSLFTEAFGMHIPKGYLYAAIGFSILIEFFNQWESYNNQKSEKRKPLRLRTAQAVLRLLGDEGLVLSQKNQNGEEEDTSSDTTGKELTSFAESEEVNIFSRVLTMSDRTVRSIMTHRSEVIYIDLDDPLEEQIEVVKEKGHSILPVCRGGLDNVIGVAQAGRIYFDILEHGGVKESTVSDPLIVPETMRVISLLKPLRDHTPHFVLVTDEYGTIEGIITAIDFFEAIAGELCESGEPPEMQQLDDGSWLVAGQVDVHLLEAAFEIPGLVSESNDYSSFAGFMLSHFGRLPEKGDSFVYQGYRFTVMEVEERRIALGKIEECVDS